MSLHRRGGRAREREREREREHSALFSTFYKDTNSILGLAFMVPSKSNYLPKASPTDTIIMEVRASSYEWGNRNIQSIT
jgi:hypothetical protein